MPTECEHCGMPLNGASYTLPWEDDDNPYGYYTCPYCGHQNVDYTDDDD